MIIRPATSAELDDVMRIYDIARQAMRDAGNEAQWINGYPSRTLIEGDIARGACYVVEDDGALHGVFMFAVEDDPTYAHIEDGAWPNDEPYGVIHRIGSAGARRGILQAAVDFGLKHVDNLRIDTHADNEPMQHALAKAGFTKCGVIYCQDGTPRDAFHRVR